ncbi:hypothetical protein HK405_002197, partial [Cladochytrium tenue]
EHQDLVLSCRRPILRRPDRLHALHERPVRHLDVAQPGLPQHPHGLWPAPARLRHPAPPRGALRRPDKVQQARRQPADVHHPVLP